MYIAQMIPSIWLIIVVNSISFWSSISMERKSRWESITLLDLIKRRLTISRGTWTRRFACSAVMGRRY